ncbi:MAG: glucose-6-phosphate isomerase [Tissierellia bacterium]|nr:glucose-6-phosphate isomerase [Tissierellia bacterium]
MIRINLENALLKEDVSVLKEEVLDANKTLLSKTGEGNDFLGWQELPRDYDKEEFARIKEAAKKIRSNSDVLIAIGIGGSYLGAKAVIDALSNSYEKPEVEVLFAGHHLSSTDTQELLDYLDGKDFSINVISKSGTTTEPAVAFRIFKDKLEEKYGVEGAKERIFATTDKERGALKTLSTNMGYETFVVPDNVGGRFSVLTAVGLLPIAVAGFDIDELMAGARDGMDTYPETPFEDNAAFQYVAARNLMYRNGKKMEILVNYEPKLKNVSEWWKQLYGESEGKDGKGLFPVSVGFTTDLHSLGQMIQDGEKIFFETVLRVNEPKKDIELKSDDLDLDGLNYLVGKTMDYVNQTALKATVEAHVSGQVPNIILDMEKIDERNLGRLIYFYEYAVALSGYIIGVNPFNQPGVEEYKKNMFRLLEKPGY